MSMFDTYRPSGIRECPACGARLENWQGKDGPCALFIWVEGILGPVSQDIDDDEVEWPASDRGRFSLPDRFTIYSYDCVNHQPIEADCLCSDGVWSGTILRPFEGKHQV